MHKQDAVSLPGSACGGWSVFLENKKRGLNHTETPVVQRSCGREGPTPLSEYFIVFLYQPSYMITLLVTEINSQGDYLFCWHKQGGLISSADGVIF